MLKEKYSRQIRLFGSSVQNSIENTHMVIVCSAESCFFKELLERLAVQIGSTLCPCQPGKENAQHSHVLFAVDTRPGEALPRPEKFIRAFYISTSLLRISSAPLPAAPSTCTLSLSSPSSIEYCNILAGVCVQEFIKGLEGAAPQEVDLGYLRTDFQL
ncbi:hypothetical protein NECID01_0648 [Nematocida sp. AWRm77]|nr:hypothetical protein NECID01_0648 [Nematocida sp. AWRm77]